MRIALVEAAITALRDLTTADLISAIGTREIAKRAGASPTSLFYHFKSVEEFATAVLDRIFDPDSLPQELTHALIDRVRAGRLPLSELMALHEADLARLMADPEFRLRHGLWALGGQAADQAYRRYLTETDARTNVFAEAVFEGWGRELRPPFDIRSYMAAHVALLSGFTIRRLIDPDVGTTDAYTRAAAAILMVVPRTKGARHTVDDRLAELNYFPLRAPGPGQRATSRRQHTRSAILRAAANLLEKRGYEETTLDQIARSARVSTSTVREHYTTKAAIAAAVFRRLASDALEDSDAPMGLALDRLRQNLSIAAELTVTSSASARLYLSELVVRAPSTTDRDTLRETILHLTRAIADDGLLPQGIVADDVADILLSAVLSQALERPSEGGRGTVERVLRMFAFVHPIRTTGPEL